MQTLRSAVPERDIARGVSAAARVVLIVTERLEFAETAAAQMAGQGFVVRVFPPDTDLGGEWTEPHPPMVALIDAETTDGEAGPIETNVRELWPDCHLVALCEQAQTPTVTPRLNRGEIAGYLPCDVPLSDECIATLVSQICDGEVEPPKSRESKTEARVLVIDDDAVSCELAQWILQQHDFQVVVAQSAERARQALQTQSFDVILLDVHLEHVSGIRLLAALRYGRIYRDRNVPIIMVTGDRTHDTLMQAADLNIQGYVLKPYAPDLLVSKVRKAAART